MLPYINPDTRPLMERQLAPLLKDIDDVEEGELNYIITRLVDSWLGEQPNYMTYNAAVGILECVKLELVRRVLVPYEDKKCLEQGDVYQPRDFKSMAAAELTSDKKEKE